MKGDPTVLKNLNAAASLEAGLSQQYMLDARLFDDMGLHGLKAGSRAKLSRHIFKAIIDRILDLDGTPAYQIAAPQDSNSLTAIFQHDLELETALLAQYQEWCKQAWDAKDDNTRNLFEHWIKWHENDHVEWLEEQIDQIQSLTEVRYIAQKI